MTRKRIISALVLLALIALIWAIYVFRYPTYSWNQRLTLTVSTPEGVVSGSSVIRRKISYQPQTLPDVGERTEKIRGEAVVLRLGDGKYLFALVDRNLWMLKSAYGDELPKIAFGGEGMKTFLRGVRRLRGVRDLPFEHLPMLITFADMSDLSSVQLVDPNDLGATFGEGYALEEALLEVTKDRVTTGVVGRVLPCAEPGFRCIPVNFELSYGAPLRNIPNSAFRRD